MLRFLLSIIILHSIANPIYAKDEVFEKLVNAKSLKCIMGPGVTTEWKKGKIKTEPAEFGATLHFDSIDLKKRTARLIGNQSATDVTAFVTATGITFIELIASGNISVTTVYFEYSDKSSMQYKVVQSRHLSLLVEALPSQYYGSCKIWE